jgi:hypothetical protein
LFSAVRDPASADLRMQLAIRTSGAGGLAEPETVTPREALRAKSQ